jgi:hypothetical protein
MALTVTERKVLIDARDLIRTRAQTFVCHAIEAAYVESANPDTLMKAKERLRKYIRFSLEPGCTTLGSWIAKQNKGRWMSDALGRKARIAWITWMLGEEIVVDAQTASQFARFTKKG